MLHRIPNTITAAAQGTVSINMNINTSRNTNCIYVPSRHATSPEHEIVMKVGYSNTFSRVQLLGENSNWPE